MKYVLCPWEEGGQLTSRAGRSKANTRQPRLKRLLVALLWILSPALGVAACSYRAMQFP